MTCPYASMDCVQYIHCWSFCFRRWECTVDADCPRFLWRRIDMVVLFEPWVQCRHAFRGPYYSIVTGVASGQAREAF